MNQPAGSNAYVDSRPPLVLFEPGLPTPRITPSEPLGPWALGPLERLLRASEPDRPVVCDLSGAPVTSPSEVAAVLWLDDLARDLGVELEMVVPDMVSAELLDFAGVDSPVLTPEEQAALHPPVRRASAY